MVRLDGQVVLVTGAGRGLGAAYARLLGTRGAVVCVHDAGVHPDGTGHDPSFAASVCDDIAGVGGRASAHVQDLGTRDGCDALVAEVMHTHRRLDALVHNAGIVRYAGIAQTTAEEWSRTAAINIDAAWWLCRAVWPAMIAQAYGRIVLTTSGFGLRVHAGADVAAYSVSKGAQFGLMNALAAEGAPHGVLVNAVAPVAATRIFRRPVASGELMPESVAPGVAVLVARDCPVTGHVLTAAGGRWSLQRPPPADTHDLGADATPEDVLEWMWTTACEQ